MSLFDGSFSNYFRTSVGTAGATTVGTVTDAGATVIPVAGAMGFSAGQTITIDSGANHETAVVASISGGRRGFGITLTTVLTRAHDSGAQVAGNVPTPGAPNKYNSRPQ